MTVPVRRSIVCWVVEPLTPGWAVGLALGDVGLGPGDGAAADGVDGHRVVEAVVVGEVPAAAVRAQASGHAVAVVATSTVLVRFSAVPPLATRQRSLLAWAGPATRSRGTTVRARTASLRMSIQAIRRGRSYAPAMIAHRTCPLCEATCGLEIDVDDGRVERIRGDADDVFSHGFICPKGVGAQAAARGPRPAAHAAGAARRRAASRRPGTRRSRRSTGASRRSSAEHGRDAVAVYLGNPNAHNLVARCSTAACCCKALGTQNIYSAITVDQMPKQVVGRADVRRRC